MKNLTLLTIFLLFIIGFQQANAQGCVAIRGGSSCSATVGESNTLAKGELLFGTGLRYFKSFRHFRGSEEEHERLEENTEVINNSYFLDLSLNYGISDRLYANAILPFVHHKRSSLYEHGREERNETSSKGLSDIRLGVGYWLFNPNKVSKFNYAVGLGVKLPTGKYDYMDTFYNQGSDKNEDREAVVDQSIQPGDGGTGITLDLQGFHVLSPSFVVSANLYYLFNFQETNGVLTRNGRSEFSVPDQFAARLGVYYNTSIRGLSTFLGARAEGVPSNDLIGGKAGYRRPGYAISVEPGLSYNIDRFSFNVSVPIAVVRNRTRSYEDKQSGPDKHGDAAFADYLLNFNFSYRFGGKHKMDQTTMPQWDEVKDAKQ